MLLFFLSAYMPIELEGDHCFLDMMVTKSQAVGSVLVADALNI